MNDGYHFGCYGEVIRKFAIKRKDPWPIPIGPRKPLSDTVIVSKICWLFPAKSGGYRYGTVDFCDHRSGVFQNLRFMLQRYLARPA